MDPDDLPFAVDDELVTTAVDAEDFSEQKMAAMRAHATQISVEDGFFALSNNLGSRALGRRVLPPRPGHAGRRPRRRRAARPTSSPACGRLPLGRPGERSGTRCALLRSDSALSGVLQTGERWPIG